MQLVTCNASMFYWRCNRNNDQSWSIQDDLMWNHNRSRVGKRLITKSGIEVSIQAFNMLTWVVTVGIVSDDFNKFEREKSGFENRAAILIRENPNQISSGGAARFTAHDKHNPESGLMRDGDTPDLAFNRYRESIATPEYVTYKMASNSRFVDHRFKIHARTRISNGCRMYQLAPDGLWDWASATFPIDTPEQDAVRRIVELTAGINYEPGPGRDTWPLVIYDSVHTTANPNEFVSLGDTYQHMDVPDDQPPVVDPDWDWIGVDISAEPEKIVLAKAPNRGSSRAVRSVDI